MPTYTVECHDDLQNVKDLWHDIQTENGYDSPLHDYDVVSAWYCHLGGGDRPRILSLWENSNRCIGIYPMLLEKKYGARVLKTMYSGALSINLPLVRKAYRDDFFTLFFQAISSSSLRWEIIKLSWFPTYLKPLESLNDSFFRKMGFRSFPIDDIGYGVDLQKEFNSYFNGLSPKTRKNVAYLTRKLNRSHDVRFEFLHNQDALDSWESFLDIECSGWKKKCGTSLAQNPPYRTYCHNLAVSLCREGSLLMAFLTADEVRIAGMFGYIQRGVYYALRSGYLEKYFDYSPSNLLLVEMVRYFMIQMPDVNRIDLFPFDYGYKHKWSDLHEPYRTFMIANATPFSKLLYFFYAFKMKHLNKSKKGLPRNQAFNGQ
jgi:CelD/BcsL family acetyltransferase involved in cellulose biosynthesis